MGTWTSNDDNGRWEKAHAHVLVAMTFFSARGHTHTEALMPPPPKKLSWNGLLHFALLCVHVHFCWIKRAFLGSSARTRVFVWQWEYWPPLRPYCVNTQSVTCKTCGESWKTRVHMLFTCTRISGCVRDVCTAPNQYKCVLLFITLLWLNIVGTPTRAFSLNRNICFPK